MSTTYITIDGDMVDALAFKQYGRTDKVVEAIYAANPGLADYGPILPAGVTITMPDAIETTESRKTKLWE